MTKDETKKYIVSRFLPSWAETSLINSTYIKGLRNEGPEINIKKYQVSSPFLKKHTVEFLVERKSVTGVYGEKYRIEYSRV